MASGNTLAVFLAVDNVPPTANFATPDTRNMHPVLDFDVSAVESAIFHGILPRQYSGGGLTVTLYWQGTTGTSGNVVWNVSFERLGASGQDLDSNSFASAQTATTTAPATSGVQQSTVIPFTSGAQMASLLAGESFRLKVTRNGGTMAGDAELWGLEVMET
jgi:hypothetical protein